MRIGSVVAGLVLLTTTAAVKQHDFKTCSQSGFCRRGRALADRAASAGDSWKSPYALLPDSITLSPVDSSFTGTVKSALYPDVNFGLEIRLHDDGVFRIRMDEVGGLKKRYDGTADWALIKQPNVSTDGKWVRGKKDIRESSGDVELVVQYEPLQITLLRAGKVEVQLNGEGLLHMEHFRTKEEASPPQEEKAIEGTEEGAVQEPVTVPNPRAWFEGDTQDAWWDETFNSWTDTKPKGPESLSIDINFPRHPHVYGIPQHATRLSLPTTRGEDAVFSDPYRLYNADVFEYLASSTMSLYGSIPLIYGHSVSSTVGVFHAIGSETWIDVKHTHPSQSTETHWVSESGILDIFILPGPTPEAVFGQYARLTGTPVMPPHWSLGYHQCRWNYVSSDDVRSVQKRFDEEDMPVDVFWLDIEYAEDHKYFMWNDKTFPDPVEMTNDVAAVSRKMVAIVDPHLKRVSNYPAYQQASDLGILVKPKSGEGEYEGWCWPGSSSWVDFFNPIVLDWWKSLFKFTPSVDGSWSWTKSTEDIHIWNDMNEPSVFNGPEITMPKDNIHYGGWEHRDIHNINGMLFTNATSQAVSARTKIPQRPFVLTRSFFAGSQRFGAMWTGDNLGTWEHMAVGLKMVLANSIAGMSFSGADVGGFFGNPDPEMLVRWYQVGIMGPFFRAHAHIDTKRREPYLLDEPHKSIVRDLLKLRYSMLPVWYTAFRETSVTGVPVSRPQFVMFPQDEGGFDIDEQFYIGSSGLLVRPITEQGATETSVYFSDEQVYYNYFNQQAYFGGKKTVTVQAPLDHVPMFIRGGSIVPTRERSRRSSPLMKLDPFTLRVALNSNSPKSKAERVRARGELYLDDGVTYNHEKGELVWREFIATSPPKAAGKGKEALRISSRDLAAHNPTHAVDGVELGIIVKDNAFAKSVESVRVERIIVLGLENKPSKVEVVARGSTRVLPSEEWEFENGVSATGGKNVKDGERGSSFIVKSSEGLVVTSDWEIIVYV
jgi:alpha 1,3-glucosidase